MNQLLKITNLISRLRLVRNYYSGIATIFLLHRVSPFESDRLFPNERMKVSPDFLERFILQLKKYGYNFINLNELYYILTNNIKSKKNIIFTFDDGYKDNYTYAYPIFKRNKIPFTIYITPSFIENKGTLWWYNIEDLIINNERVKLGDGRELETKTYDEKNKVFLYLRDIILSLNQKNLIEELNNLFCYYNIDWFSKTRELCLSWDQVEELANDVHVTIGGHTVNHLVFKDLTEVEIIDEIIEANDIIENKIHKKVEHFAYPFGSRKEVGIRELDIVKSLDLKTATTTRDGNIFYQHKKYLNALPRIMLTENFNLYQIGRLRKRRIRKA